MQHIQKKSLRIRHRKLFGRSIGPDLDDRGYENIGSMDYPLLPVSVEIYRGERRPVPSPSTCQSERSGAK